LKLALEQRSLGPKDGLAEDSNPTDVVIGESESDAKCHETNAVVLVDNETQPLEEELSTEHNSNREMPIEEHSLNMNENETVTRSLTKALIGNDLPMP
jgi:hypothetical protein